MKKNNAEIYVKNVSKQFKEIVALNNVSVQFQSGKLYGLIGPAGAGKSTAGKASADPQATRHAGEKYPPLYDAVLFFAFGS